MLGGCTVEGVAIIVQMDATPLTEAKSRCVAGRWVFFSLLVLAGLAFAAPLQAARVSDLFAAEVPAAELGDQSLDAAFGQALGRVLVKVTGRRSAAGDAEIAAAFGDPSVLVQQYRSDAAGNLWVQFDSVALKRMLDAAGQPIWPEDRPGTLIWLAVDTGRGGREILAAAPDGANSQVSAQRAGGGSRSQRLLEAVREELLEAASGRGLPVVLPLVDSDDLSVVGFADIWGDFDEPVTSASQRYDADLILIGRARVFGPGEARARWTVLMANERYNWEGGITDGPEELADLLALQMATTADSARNIRVRVAGIDSFDGYGEVSTYLSGLGIVETCDVEWVEGSVVMFTLRVRGDEDQLMRSIALRRLLQPVESEPAVLGSPGRSVRPGLHYQLIAGP
jgi:hypothetical protein